MPDTLASFKLGAWLALDTISSKASLALGELPAAPIKSRTFEGGKGLDQTLALEVETFLTLHDLSFADLKGLIVCCGPGSFTGLRNGMAYMQGLAYGLDIPLLGLSATECAYFRFNDLPDLPVQILLPAKKRPPDLSFWAQRLSSDWPQKERVREVSAEAVDSDAIRGDKSDIYGAYAMIRALYSIGPEALLKARPEYGREADASPAKKMKWGQS